MGFRKSRSQRETYPRFSDNYLLSLLIFAPHLPGDGLVLNVLFDDPPPRSDQISRTNRHQKTYVQFTILDPAVSELIGHHLRDESERHHPMRYRSAEPRLPGKLWINVQRVVISGRLGIAIDLILVNRFDHRRQFIANVYVLKKGLVHQDTLYLGQIPVSRARTTSSPLSFLTTLSITTYFCSRLMNLSTSLIATVSLSPGLIGWMNLKYCFA